MKLYALRFRYYALIFAVLAILYAFRAYAHFRLICRNSSCNNHKIMSYHENSPSQSNSVRGMSSRRLHSGIIFRRATSDLHVFSQETCLISQHWKRNRRSNLASSSEPLDLVSEKTFLSNGWISLIYGWIFQDVAIGFGFTVSNIQIGQTLEVDLKSESEYWVLEGDLADLVWLRG